MKFFITEKKIQLSLPILVTHMPETGNDQQQNTKISAERGREIGGKPVQETHHVVDLN